MVTDNHYRWDFIGLSTDSKPTPATSEKVVNGSTFYCSDTSKLYVFCKDTWYERKPLGSGGGGTTYTAGTGIDITEDTISIDEEVVATLEELNARIVQGEGTPTTSTEGVVGGLYEDTTNGKLYICTAITAGTDPDPDTYTWEEVGGGGGTGVTILTSNDYNYPSDNPDRIALPLLPQGFYTTIDNDVYVQEYNNRTGKAGTLYYVSGKTPQNEVNVWVFNKDYGIGNVGVSPVNMYKGNPITGNLSSRSYLVTEEELIQYVGKQGPSDPTNVSGAQIGQIYVNNVNDSAFVCVDATSGAQVWKQITS